MNKKFTIEELSNIKPGDLVLYPDFYEEWHEVLEVAVRCGLNKDGLLNSDDDYLTVKNGKCIDEVDYDSIMGIKKQNIKFMNKYIRTKDNEIYEIDKYNNCLNLKDWLLSTNKLIRYDGILSKDIVNESDDILDLIQVGDLIRTYLDYPNLEHIVEIEDKEDLLNNRLLQHTSKIYVKQGDDYILVWDINRGVVKK